MHSKTHQLFHCILHHYFLIEHDDRFDILTEMMPVASSWKAIGTGLRIEPGRLDTIQESNLGKPRECLSEMLTCWLKRNYNVKRFGEPTWQAVMKVVAHHAAGDNCALALNIAKQHLGKRYDSNCFCVKFIEVHVLHI